MSENLSIGLVICDHGSRRAASNEMLETFVERFITLTDYAIVEPAHMELAEPSIETAVARCVERGASHIVLAPYFLAPGKHWQKDIPDLVEAACQKVQAEKGVSLTWLVSQPIGLHDAMVNIIDDRTQYCLSRAKGEVEACDACAGTDRCQFRGACSS